MLSTISAAKKGEDNMGAIILGKDMNSAVNDLKKCDHLKKIYTVDDKMFENSIPENLSNAIAKFIDGKDFHILSPSTRLVKICPQNSLRS